jgi:cyclic-di-GMP phosphodiesterase TipF (flagellum assembly factor)
VTLSSLAGLFAYAAVAVAVALAVPRLLGAGAPSTQWIGIVAGLVVFVIGALLQEVFTRRSQVRALTARLGEIGNIVARLRSDFRDFAVGRTSADAPAQDLVTLTAEMKIMKSLVAQLSTQAQAGPGERPGVRPALSALARPLRDPTEPFIGPPGSHPDARGAAPALAAMKPRQPGAAIAPGERTQRAAVASGPVEPTGLTDEDRLLDVMRDALNNDRVDLYFEPIVGLPQRRLAHQQCVAWIRAADGTLIPPDTYLDPAARAGLLGAIDNLLLVRLVPLVRRLRRQRIQGLTFFCRISPATLNDRELFGDFYGFMDENRDLNQHVVFEIHQYDFYHLDKRTALELENLSKAGFRFALGEVLNLDLFVSDLSDRGFRYVKVPGTTLLEKLARAGDPRALKRALDPGAIDLIATDIGSDARLLELLDYGIDFGQGPVFGEARPEELA